MQVELSGRVVAVLPTQSGQGKNGLWEKNSFVIEWLDNGFTHRLCFEVMGTEKWEKMKQSVVVGNDVQCRFSVSSHEYKGRYYTSCQCFYCAAVGGSVMQNNAPSAPSSVQSNNDGGDVSPF